MKISSQKFTSLDEIELYNLQEEKRYQTLYKTRKGYKILRGWDKSPERKLWRKYANQRLRRYKTRQIEEVKENIRTASDLSNIPNLTLLDQTVGRPFWLELWYKSNNTIYDLINKYRVEMNDFVALIRLVNEQTLTTIRTIRSNNEVTLSRNLKSLYIELENAKIDHKKATNQTIMFRTSTILYKFEDLYILDIEVLIPNNLVNLF